MHTKTPETVARTDIFNIHFYEKSRFHGSLRGMHYRIGKTTDETGETHLRVTTWPGPYNFDTTDDSRKESALFDFSNEGLDAVTEYLNQQYASQYRGIDSKPL